MSPPRKDYFFCVFGTEIALRTLLTRESQSEVWIGRTPAFFVNYMGQSEPPQESAIQARQAGLFRRSAAWLFSQQHFHFKLLSGTAAGVSVIVLLAGIFLDRKSTRLHSSH